MDEDNKVTEDERFFKKIPKRKYKVYCRCMQALGGLLLLSILVKFIFGKSCFMLLCDLFPCLMELNQRLRMLINTVAILKIAETVGLGSILITWIYGAIDKREFGISYGELLEKVFPGYVWGILSHFLNILLCMWLAKMSILEGAMLSLFLVLGGCLLQWKIVGNLILPSNKQVGGLRRRRIAISIWNQKIKDGLKEAEKNREEVLITICNMADVVSLKDNSYYDGMGDCFSEALLAYTEAYHTKETILQDISKIWDRLLRVLSKNEQDILVCDVLHRVENETRNEGTFCLGLICAGYVLYLLSMRMEAACEHDIPPEEVLIGIANELDAMERRSFYETGNTKVPSYWNDIFTLLVWMYFLNGQIELRRDLFDLDFAEKEKDKELLRKIATAAFRNKSTADYFEIAYSQMLTI